jgi:hypothetical protein
MTSVEIEKFVSTLNEEQLRTELRIAKTLIECWKFQYQTLAKQDLECRQLLYDKTGIEFFSKEEIRNRVAPTQEDRDWLKSIGIEL